MSTLDHLLTGSSRTFALSIPLLPEPVRSEITTAYLLFRIADTIEDEFGWTDEQRLEGLRSMRTALETGALTGASVGEWLVPASVRLEHEGYAQLFEQAGLVVAVLRGLDRGASGMISEHLVRTMDGMIRFVERDRRTRNLNELLAYCYSVAGIVGELCTALFLRSYPSLRAAENELMEASARYGEGLQLVNILRDSPCDEEARRRFLPQGVKTTDLIEIARQDLVEADLYVQTMLRCGAPPGVIAFNMLNIRLAQDTLTLIARHGAGVKIRRVQVQRIFDQVVAQSGA